MYAREIDGLALTLGVSGMLWNRSLVVYDKETGTLWSHILGEAMQGSLRGKRLEQVPSTMTDWKSWSSQHPEGTVVRLSRTSRHYRREFYRDPREFVLGIAADGVAKAWRFDRLTDTPTLNDTFADQPVAVLFDRASITARLYERRVNDQVLTFESSNGRISDQQTGSIWEPLTGRALQGPLKGVHLRPLPAIVSFRKVWYSFHPESK